MIQNPNQSPNNNVFSFSSQHQLPRCCGATSIDGYGKGAPATDSGAVKLVNAGAAKGREEMAVLMTMMNATTNAMPGSPPASASASAAAATNNNDNNDNNNDNGFNLDALRRRVRALRRMLDASANRLAHAEGSSVDGG